MLVHTLAVAVALGSVTLYLAAFFFPEVHRKHDFFWSGVGCFYGLVLWVDAGQMTTTEFFGHLAGVALVVWFGWQTLLLRRRRTPRDLQTPLTDKSWQAFGQDIAALTTAWLKHTPLKPFLRGSRAENVSQPLTEGGFRASSLKQVDYEFLDELPPSHNGTLKGKVPQPEAGLSASREVQSDALNRLATATKQQSNAQGFTEPKPSPQQPKGPQPPQKPLTLVQKGLVLKDWLVELVTTATTPKPKKPVIVIPPRETAGPQPSNNRGPSEGSDSLRSQPDTMAAPAGEPPIASKPAPDQTQSSQPFNSQSFNNEQPGVIPESFTDFDPPETVIESEAWSDADRALIDSEPDPESPEDESP